MDDLRTIIDKIYRDYNPEKISNVPGILEKYKGNEAELLSKISGKYNIRLEDYITVDYMRLVKAILTKYDPVNVSSFGTLLASYYGREKELLKTLGEKYNAGFNDIIISIYATGLLEQDQPSKYEKGSSVFPRKESHPNEMPTGKSSKTRVIIIATVAILLITLVVLYSSGVFRSGTTAGAKEQEQTATNGNPKTDVKTSINDVPASVNKPEEKITEKPLKVISVTASSFMKPSGNLSYSPSNVTDHNLQTWWTPSPPHSDGYDSWLRIDFEQTRKVVAIEIHNGSHYPYYPKYGDLYLKNNRLFKANLEFSNGYTQTINLREVDEIQKISIPMQNTTYVKLIPLEWGRGTQWNDLCISEFTAIGE
jgi:hypothetical protein